MKNYNYQIPVNLEGMRLDKALCELCLNVSRSRIQKAIKDCHIKVNMQIINDSATKVKENDIIDVSILESATLEMTSANINLDIMYEDDDLIVINKPVGLTVHPGAGNHQDTLVNALLHHSKSLSNIGGEERPGIVHRLDKDTSGLMVVAKNNDAHVSLSSQIETRSLVRKYKALVWGIINPATGTIKANIGRNKIARQKMSVMKVGGKTALTHYRTEAIFLNGLISLVECTLETGRTHQIRVHLSHIKHSVVGDQTYGNNSRKVQALPQELQESFKNFKHQALHSYYIAFSHPVTSHILEFTADFPEDIKRLIESL